MTADPLAILFFFLFMALTLGITWWAARRTQSTEQFFAAGGGITAGQNGFALAGDYLSAGALLGIAGLITANGFDGLIYSIGWLVGWPILLFLIAEPLRNLGKYTFADVVAMRLKAGPVRLAASVGTMIVILLYLIAQMVATGSLIKLLFGLPYSWSVAAVGTTMLVYVLFGGMLATTWVQIVKAALLLGGGILLAILVLVRFDMNPLALFAAAAHQFGDRVLQPGDKVAGSGWDAISLGIGLMFGTAGMPHVLMRIFTVRDALRAPHVRALCDLPHRPFPSDGVRDRLRRHGHRRTGHGRGRRRRRQHGGTAAGPHRRRRRVLRLHRRRLLRDHAGGRRRPDPVGRRHLVP